MVKTCIQVTVLFLTLVASTFLIMASIGLSAEDIANIGTSKWGYSEAVIESLSIEKTNALSGVK